MSPEVQRRLQASPIESRHEPYPGAHRPGPAGDLRRFNHHRQFLKFGGLDLSTQQSGQFRRATKLSKLVGATWRYSRCQAHPIWDAKKPSLLSKLSFLY
jgi:hypothetical protein